MPPVPFVLGFAAVSVAAGLWHCEEQAGGASTGSGQRVPESPCGGQGAAVLPGLVLPGYLSSGHGAWPHPAAHQEES